MTRKLTVLVYMSARDVIPEFRTIGENLGQLIAAHGHFACWGGGDAGLMGSFAKSAYLSGADTFGVAHGGLARGGHETATHYATISMIPDNFNERIRIMQGAADAVVVMPGGYGSYQEMLRLVKAIEEGSIPKIPLVIVNPKLDGQNGFWDSAINQLRLSVERGHLKEQALETLRIVENAGMAVTVVEDFYRLCTDSQWKAHKAQQLIYVPQHHAQILENNKIIGELKNKRILGDFVALIGSSVGESQVLPTNNCTYEAVPEIIDILKFYNRKVICINSNRGLNGEIMSQAARKGVLGMVLSTPSQDRDGRVAHYVANAVHARFDNMTQLSGFITRRAKVVLAMPGSDDILMDLLSDYAIKSHGFSSTQALVFNANDYFDNMLSQIHSMENGKFAAPKGGTFDDKNSLIGLASLGIVGDGQSNQEINPIVPFVGCRDSFMTQLESILCGEPRKHYSSGRPDYTKNVEIPGMVLSPGPSGLSVAKTILHGPDLARPDARTARIAAEAVRIAAARRRELVAAR
jgi:uncharacterized protein (TIGR00730 family)